MDQFTDIQIIECNRLHSEEAKGGNNENYSLWTNNLQDILMLYPKDQVSVYGAFISERGAGQPSSIEIKGVELGEDHEYTYTTLEKPIFFPDRPDLMLPSRCSRMVATETKQSFKLRDDELKFVMNYFIPADCRCSLHLPRRFMYYYTASPRQNYTEVDGWHQGACVSAYDVANFSTTHHLWHNKQLYRTLPYTSGAHLYKPNNDNSRYTLMIRDTTFFSSEGFHGGLGLTPGDLRDPENADYTIYRELKTLNLPSGFNSPDFIATEITRQLNNIINDDILVERRNVGEQYPQPVMKLLESETYKAFFTGNIDDMTEANFLYYFNLVTSGNSNTAQRNYRTPTFNLSGFEWLRQYNIVGCKYPEIYEKGKKINFINTGFQGIKGSRIATQINLATITADTPIELDITYSKTDLQYLKDFIDAQKLYPEILLDLNDGYSGYEKGITMDNTRWIHINRYDNLKMSLANPPTEDTAQLGWGGYYLPRSWQPTALQQLRSLMLLLYYDSSQAETYYEKPDYGLNQFSYGCFGRSSAGRITIYPFKHETNGIGTNQIEELKLTATTTPGIIEVGRKIGFDLHFNAPGMYYLLPLSGWASHPDATSSNATDISIFNVNADDTNTTATAPEFYMSYWQKLLYIGADEPKLNWDGTNFSFSDFHTPRNRGNIITAKKGVYSATGIPAFDDFASDVVYHINPPELYNDYTPDRCPYVSNYNLSSSTSMGNVGFQALRTNQNYMPFKIYDQICGIMIEDFGVPEDKWSDSLWGLLGFTYKQFHGTTNRQVRIQVGNSNDLSVLTTNAEIVESDTKLFITNWAGIPLYTNMINVPVTIKGYNSSGTFTSYNKVLPQIIHKTQSISIVANNLPTRMIRGYYCIRSNILEGTPFIGGKVNNTTMPIIGIVDKINGDGDFYFGQESSLSFTITKPIRLASISIGIHDPDGSYARTSEQSTILFKVQRPVATTFNIAQEIMQEQMGKKNPKM